VPVACAPQVQQVQEAAAKAATQLHVTPRSTFRLWSDEEVAAAQPAELEPSPVADTFGALMTGTYSRLQSRAADTVGVDPGGGPPACLHASPPVAWGRSGVAAVCRDACASPRCTCINSTQHPSPCAHDCHASRHMLCTMPSCTAS
jgi:hypothetical protein